MKFFIKSFSVILSVMLILSSLPMVSFATTKLDGGYCGAEGNNLMYSLDSDGLLTISGTGKMADWAVSDAPWYFYNSDIKEITIEDGVTSIGNYAFAGCSNVESVNMPDSVTSIGNHSFDYCYIIENIAIPDSVSSIGEYAFYNCGWLKSITIPDSVTSIAECAFLNCTRLESVVIGKGLSSISADAFSRCEKLTSITVNEENPACYSKNNCIILKDTKTLVLGGNNSVIPADGSVTSIDNYAFSGCINLESVTIPASVTDIGFNPFKGCDNLKSITVDEKNPVYYSKNNCVINKETKELVTGCKNSIIPDDENITSIGAYAFKYCSGLESIAIPDGVTSIGVSAFEGCSELKNITIPDSVKTIGTCAFTDTEYYNITGNWENGLLYIGNWLVAADSEATEASVSFKKGTLGIAAFTFNGFSNITSITIPDGATSICDGAFDGCSNLANITIPDSITYIGNYAFSETEYYNNTANWENGLLYIGKWLIAGNSDTMGTSVSVKDGTIGIASNAFYWCLELTDVTIPESVTSICNSAFASCSALTSVTIPKNVTNIGSSVFYNCYEIESITVDKNNTAYKSINNCLVDVKNKRLLSGCKNSVIPTDGSVTSIDNYAFYNCADLKNIAIPACVTSIGNNAFSGCSNLESITVDKNNTVYKSAGNCLIDAENKKLILGCNNSVIPVDGSITAIGEEAFSCCVKLKSVIIPDTVTSIGDYAFDFCYELESVTIPDSVTSIGTFAFYCCNKLDNITIPAYITNIGRGAFAGCSEIESVTIPGTVKNIYDYTFNSCSKLESVIISDGVTSIGDYAFSDCSVLESITIFDSVTSIGDFAFTNCSANLTVKCYKDSYAEKYAVDNSIKYEYMHKHTWDNGVVTKAATCKATGVMTYTCTECKTTKTETIEKTDSHTFGEWVVKTAATYEADGEKSRTCSVCGKEETKAIAKLVVAETAGDEETGIQMNFAEGTFTEKNVTLEVKPATKDTEVYKVVSNLKPDNNFEIYDISALSGETKVQPNGNVQISIPLSDKFDSENVSIYYVNDKGEMEKLQSYVKDGKIVFETNHFSYYVVIDEASPKTSDITLGDVNSDGKINTKDARKILRYVAKLEKFTTKQESAADVNKDTKINTKDARKILRVVAKLETM